jgi:hypothetical protein
VSSVTLGHAWVTRKSKWHKGVTLVTQKRWVRWFGARYESRIAAGQHRTVRAKTAVRHNSGVTAGLTRFYPF